MDLNTLTIHETAARLERGEFSPVALVEAYLDRIERLDPKLNAFITLTPELALQQARQAEVEIQRGELRGPLHGIPVALKDLYETAGILTTAGSTFFREFIPESDAPLVAALLKAGAILLGKLNMHEIALGLTNENPHFGACRNPWKLDCIPGGSSGGSGAALAAGLCLGSLGSDTGGSIRVPASLCGVVGLKPTYGRVSKRGVIPLSWHLDHAGPMARCVRDTAILLQAIAGYDTGDPYCQDVAVSDYLAGLERGVSGWRIALASGSYFDEVEDGIASLIEQAANVLTEQGAEIERVELTGIETAALANTSMILADAAFFHQERLSGHPKGFGDDVRQRLQMGAETSLPDYIQARRIQATFRHQVLTLFESCDILLMPTTPLVALPLQKNQAVQRSRSLTRFTSVFNLTGLPSISVPCGFVEREGYRLPVGLQMVARPWAEAALLQAAYAYEQASGWYTHHPPIL